MIRDLVDEDGNELDNVLLEWNETVTDENGKTHDVHIKLVRIK